MVPGSQFAERPEMAAFDAVAAIRAFGADAKAQGWAADDNPFTATPWASSAWSEGWAA